ncbi:hypothetical protein GJAV_G00231070 [Gymnothorax javanicus]|nr:hypothetical protein GJAV_G00231070 [Gymnothorax javanicus]
MKQLCCNWVLTTTLLGICFFFEVCSGQSDCQPCEFRMNVSTTEISLSVCYYDIIKNSSLEARVYTIELDCVVDCCTEFVPDPGDDSSPVLLTLSGLTPGTKYSFNIAIGANETFTKIVYTRPGAISNLRVSDVTSSSVLLNWAEPQGEAALYRVEWAHDSTNLSETTSETYMRISGLNAGTLYTFRVIPLAGDGTTEGDATELQQFTGPYPVLGLNATTVNTTAVILQWHRPQGYQEGYSYRVETSGCTPAPQNQTEQEPMATITGLTPGTNCFFTVYSQVQTGTEGEPTSVYQYTKPEKVTPAVSSKGTTDTIEVTWTSPMGNVESYRVNLTASDGDKKEELISTGVQSARFSDLGAGRNYTVIVTTISGPFAEDSEPVSNATYPNPPGAIEVVQQTPDSITISWHWPQGMDVGQYSFIISYQAQENGQYQTSNNMTVFENLMSGTLYKISVATVGQMGYQSSEVTAEIYTRPYPVLGLNATTVNTTAVILQWHRPQGYQEGYSYRVETSGCTTAPRNQTAQEPMATITGLTPGTNCSFSVHSQVQSGTEGAPVSIFQYTKPETVIPEVSSRGTNDTIKVTWSSPPGNVESYRVNLTSSYGETQHSYLDSSGQSELFTGLTAGRNYTVIVTTSSGPFSEDSEPVSDATYPNPPGSIQAVQRTTDSITISWDWPQGMDVGQYSFIISCQAPENCQNRTSNNMAVLENLVSGILYKISVATVGQMGYQSSEVTAEIYTRPYTILGLNATTVSTTAVILQWHRPQGHQEGYSYRVETSGCTTAPRNQTAQEPMATITGLSPGTNCFFTVYSQVQSSTEGAPVSIYQYTKPEKVIPAVSSRGTNDTIEVTWVSPPGQVESYTVNLTSSYGDDQHKRLNSSFQSELFSGLHAGRSYTVIVTTISGPFAEDSAPVSNATYPNPPGAIQAEQQTPDSITVSWDRPQGMVDGQYSFIISYQAQEKSQNPTSENTTVLENLVSGTLYKISVATVGQMDYQSSEVTAEIYTRPYPVLGLNATTVHTTAVILQWHRPQGHQEGYSYRVETSGCTPAPRNQTEQEPMATITGLTPGTNCSFSVYSQVQSSTEGAPVSIYQYTKPEKVIPAVSNRGTNDAIEVTWVSPPGQVESYTVNLTSSYGDDQHKRLNSSFQSELFSGLHAGRIYTVIVTTNSGPFAEDSAPVSNATYPNPPGPIQAVQQAIDSITVSWGWPQGMDVGQFNFIISYQPQENGQIETSENTTVLENLVSGTLYKISVATVGQMAYHSSEVVAEIYTRPYPVLGLNATTVNTTAVILQWHRPQGHQEGYSYRVETSGCTTAPQNQTEQEPMATITGLTPGTNCSFSVYSQVQSSIEGEPVLIFQYTKPEKVIPAVSSRGTNDTIEVTWVSPPGQVESYTVNLTSSYGDDQQKRLNSSFQSELFSGLHAGRSYTVIVTTISGPFAEDSAPVSNATYPNAPGPVMVTGKTTESVTLEWIPSPRMDNGSFVYLVIYNSSVNDRKLIETPRNSLKISNLVSGTSYDISVAAVGPFQFTSQPVLLSTTTRPESIRGLVLSSTGVHMISVEWQQPFAFKPGYSYNVRVWNSTDHLIREKNTSDLDHNSTGLVPGSRYKFEVYSQTSDGTDGLPMSIDVCTDASPVVTFTCEGPNRAGPLLHLMWQSPEGLNKGFQLTWSDAGTVTLPPCGSSCDHVIQNLTYFTEYNVRIRTVGCGKNSSVYQRVCQTGITDPPEAKLATGLTILKKRTQHVFLTSNLKNADFSDENGIGLQKYLNRTYKDWKEDDSVPYLATARDTDANQNRYDQSEIELDVGSGSKWNGYENGPLKAKATYRLAFVMFTRLALKNDLVDQSDSLYSITPYNDKDVPLPEDPAVITTAALAGGLSAFGCLSGIAAFLAFRKKNAKKKSSEIPIDSMRAKVGVPVRIEDYELYYQKQSVNSNCGFAEQYEDLKPVGTVQSKSIAEENAGKNRYRNVLPYDSSRVKLSIQGSSSDDYINASYVPGYNCKKEFIAAQGPLPGTVNEFWRMLWEKNVHTLVMLTRCNEQGRVKCEEYWPSRSKHYKNFAVTTTSEIPLEDWTIRDFHVKNVKTAETRSVRQFHFTAWPDHGVPSSTEVLINFRHLVREHMDQYSRNSPTVVHCSAGVGRTGTLIAIDHLLFQIEQDSVVDLYAIVHDMRMHRGLMVQTEDQYVFLHKCALDIIKSRTGTNVDLIYQNTAALDIYEQFTPINGGAGAMGP